MFSLHLNSNSSNALLQRSILSRVTMDTRESWNNINEWWRGKCWPYGWVVLSHGAHSPLLICIIYPREWTDHYYLGKNPYDIPLVISLFTYSIYLYHLFIPLFIYLHYVYYFYYLSIYLFIYLFWLCCK